MHKHRNLLGHAPKLMHDELTEDYRDMIYADTPAADIEIRRKAVPAQMAPEMPCGLADSLEEAGDRLFRLHPPRSVPVEVGTNNKCNRAAQTRNLRRRIKTQTVLPCAETSADAALGTARLRSDPDAARSMDGRRFLNRSSRSRLTSPPEKRNLHMPGTRRQGISYQIRDTTSPRAWGTLEPALRTIVRNAVHPHVRGEHYTGR